MRLVTLKHEGRRRVGRLAADGQHIELFDCDGTRGALAVIEIRAAGQPLPTTSARVPLAGAELLSPMPLPRRNVFCVGRNYHAHAKELRDSVFKDNAKAVDAWPIVFTKVPECVVGPHDEVRLPLAV
ncbi:MAG TPA: fumarylacetoacetate hydrolase family protein, partial [Rhizobacter sp.]|nr:fumarylacetoacetate hydrolase family protein [Rhizobacter sp.]